MPLSVVTANRGKDYSIFEIFAPFVEKLVGAYKQSQQNKWDNEWMSSAIADIENANDKSVIDDYILKKDPPDDYMDIEGVTQFANDSMGLLQKKEIMTGGLTPTVAPQVGEQVGEKQVEQPQFLPDVKEFNELYKFVSELPTGQVDWTNTLNMFKEKLESGRAMGSAAQQFLNMILGQQPTDQRAKFEQDFDLASKMKKTLYPEEKIPSEWETLYTNPEKWKEIQKIKEEPETELDIDALNQFMKDNNLKLKSVTVNEKGERNISLEPITGGDPDLSDMLILIKELEKEGFDASYSKGGLSVSVPNEPEPEKGTFTTTEMNYVDKELEEVKTNEQYDTALNKIKAVDPKLANQVPSKEKMFVNNYNRAVNAIKICIDNNGKIKEGEFDKGITFEDAYQAFYNDLQIAVQEYQKATGQILQNPFVSFEEYQKSDIKPGKGLFYPSTWGQQKSVIK